MHKESHWLQVSATKILGEIAKLIFGQNLRKRPKIEKVNITHIEINLDPKFQLQQIILLSGTNFQKKYTFGPKHKKMNIIIEFSIFKLV